MEKKGRERLGKLIKAWKRKLYFILFIKCFDWLRKRLFDFGRWQI